ncbi:MAG: Crp/Fnr family transcriptional regulator [Desulfobacteraceae bacterium]|nr:Crp/Fnr family transcriptional regulator [Desulfobacteraceae bacterium]
MIEKLKTIPLFSNLESEYFSKIIDLIKPLKFEKGQFIFNEGEPGDGFYIVDTGEVKIFKISFEGKEQILHIYGPGKAFGEVPVFEGNNFPASAMAMKKSQIIFIPRNKFVNLISETPGLAMNMLGVLSMKLREFTIQIENLSLKEVPARLASYILTLSEENSKAEKVVLPISKAQLANLIGTTPETVSRVLKKMTEASLISVDTKTIIIDDYDGLIDLSDSGRLE